MASISTLNGGSDTFIREPLAFALAIVKSTPAHMSARDYVLKLRHHLKCGLLPTDDLERNHYLDLVGFWQQRCHELMRENDELKIRNTMLERANQLHEGRFGHDAVTTEETTNPAKCRKTASAGRKSTRVKAVQLADATAETSLEDDLNLLEDLEDGLLVMKHTWSFQKLLRQPDADAATVCSSLIGMASSLGRVVCNLARSCAIPINRNWQKPGLPTLAEDRSECARALAACGRVFGMLLTGLDRLNEDSPTKHLPERVIYECVKMFSVTLGAIEISALQSATKSIQAKGDDARESLSGRLVAHYLTGLMSFLDQDNMIHQKLFDGFTFTLLERVSKQLYYSVFGQHRAATVANDISQPLTYGGDDTQQKVECLATRFEMKALVVILERALSRAPSHMNPQAMSRDYSANSRVPARSRTLSMVNLPSKGKLSPMAKDRLQRTLITCMYGDKLEDDFLDLLSAPVDLGTIPNMPKIVHQSVEEWFQEQVWRLVGWDIMAQESSWLKQSTDFTRTQRYMGT